MIFIIYFWTSNIVTGLFIMNERPAQQRSQLGVPSDTPPPATEVPICTRMVAWRGNVLPNCYLLPDFIERAVRFRYHPNAATYSRTPTPSSERFHTLDKKYHLEAVEATPQVTCTLDRYTIFLFHSNSVANFCVKQVHPDWTPPAQLEVWRLQD